MDAHAHINQCFLKETVFVIRKTPLELFPILDKIVITSLMF